MQRLASFADAETALAVREMRVAARASGRSRRS